MIANNSARVLSFVLGCIAAFGAITASVGCGDNAPSSAKEITSFSFTAANNPTLHDDVAALITGDAITATVPFGTNVTALVATFRSTGVGVTAGGVVQTSGATANDFSAALTYRVTAMNATTRDYEVTITVASAAAKALTAYAFLGTNNVGIGADVTATISNTAVTATVPFGTDVTALVATFSTTGASVAVGTTLQVSGVTAHDFTNPITYTVIAGDGSTADYTVTVTVAPSSANTITAFAFLSINNSPALLADVTATITGTSITAIVPFGTDVTGLVATFATTGVSVTVDNTAQISGATANPFGAPVSYLVTAADQTTRTYTVTVSVAPSSAKDITQFTLLDTDATITGTSIALTLSFGTDLTSLAPTIAITGTGVSPASGATQDFTSPVIYTVTAADLTTKDYTVTVSVAPSNANDITQFTILGVDGTITGTSIALTLPFGTDLTSLTPTIAITGTGVSPASGAPQDFTSPVIYTVIAADLTTKDYTVTVSVAPSSAKDITQFTILGVNGTITGTNIALTVPFGTNRTSLTPTIAITGASVSPVSGAAQNFTAPVIYTVTAADLTTKPYTVTVSVAPSSAKDITQFTILGVNGTITGSSIALTVPFGTSRTSLTPTIAITGATVSPASGDSQDFTAPVVYTVTAADLTTKPYTVTVSVAPSSAKDITQFTILGVNGTISGTDIAITLPFGTALTSLTPTIEITGATVSPASGDSQDFTAPVVYTVTAADLTTKDYTVTVITAVCGNLTVEPGESCDDGNTANNDGCSHLCLFEFCGDGIVQFPAGEQCDDGNNVDGDGCNSLCHAESFLITAAVQINGNLACTTATANAAHKIAVDGSGTIYAAMQCGTSADIAVSRDRGETFSALFDLGADLPNAPVTISQVAVATGPSGFAYGALLVDDGTVYLRITTDGGVTWGAAVLIGLSADTNAGLSLQSFNDDLYIGFMTADNVDNVIVASNHRRGAGAFDTTLVTMAFSSFDLMFDIVQGTLAVASDDPGFHVRVSTDAGLSFGGEAQPPGSAIFSDWAIGNGTIFVAGGSIGGTDTSDRLYLISSSDVTSSTSVVGLPSISSQQTRSVSADAAGNAFVASELDGGGVQIDRLAAGAGAFDVARVIDPTGGSPIAAPLPGNQGVAVEYTVGNDVWVTVQAYPPPN